MDTCEGEHGDGTRSSAGVLHCVPPLPPRQNAQSQGDFQDHRDRIGGQAIPSDCSVSNLHNGQGSGQAIGQAVNEEVEYARLATNSEFYDLDFPVLQPILSDCSVSDLQNGQGSGQAIGQPINEEVEYARLATNSEFYDLDFPVLQPILSSDSPTSATQQHQHALLQPLGIQALQSRPEDIYQSHPPPQLGIPGYYNQRLGDSIYDVEHLQAEMQAEKLQIDNRHLVSDQTNVEQMRQPKNTFDPITSKTTSTSFATSISSSSIRSPDHYMKPLADVTQSSVSRSRFNLISLAFKQ